MKIKSAEFVISNTNPQLCPEPNMPEYAFIGRSNVGKSSLINYLTNNGKLSKTSATPGKTQLINHFLINDNWYLVDLPGYGYARVSKTTRQGFDKMIRYYISHRQQLLTLFVLVDVTISPQKIDLDFINWLGEMRIPFSVIFTKSDREKANTIKKNVKNFNEKLLENWESLPNYFITSSEKNRGKEEVLTYLTSLIQLETETI